MAIVLTPDMLSSFQASKPFFIGLDSDGSAFDTMEIKQKECFVPATIQYFGLQPIARQVRQVIEFAGLYSKTRGQNRFLTLARYFELLARHAAVARRGFPLPDAAPLRRWIEQETRLSNASLQAYLNRNPDPFLQRVLAWSEAVNRAIEEMVKGVEPFAGVRESLEAALGQADLVVISATPFDALAREWREHGLEHYPAAIAGQEIGNKQEQLSMAAQGRYAREQILMIGDAPGDLEAARAVGALFFPIIPGSEDESWAEFRREALARFSPAPTRVSMKRGCWRNSSAACPSRRHGSNCPRPAPLEWHHSRFGEKVCFGRYQDMIIFMSSIQEESTLDLLCKKEHGPAGPPNENDLHLLISQSPVLYIS